MVARGGAIWFFKLMGPRELVAGQKPALESFVRSVRFTNESAANPHG
jgi:hypothetical protein